MRPGDRRLPRSVRHLRRLAGPTAFRPIRKCPALPAAKVPRAVRTRSRGELSTTGNSGIRVQRKTPTGETLARHGTGRTRACIGRAVDRHSPVERGRSSSALSVDAPFTCGAAGVGGAAHCAHLSRGRSGAGRDSGGRFAGRIVADGRALRVVRARDRAYATFAGERAAAIAIGSAGGEKRAGDVRVVVAASAQGPHPN